MGKVLYKVYGAINWLAYIWLVTSEAFEEVRYRAIGDTVRGIFSEVESRGKAPKLAPRTLSYTDAGAKAANSP